MQTRQELVLMFMLSLATSYSGVWTPDRIHHEAGLLADIYLSRV